MKWWHRPPPHIIQQTLGFGRDTNGTEFISICSSGQEEVEVYGVLFGFPLKFTLVSFYLRRGELQVKGARIY